MANPKKRKTTSAKNQRRSHHALKQIKAAVCEKCGSPKKLHHACPVCGFYNGKDTSKKKEAPVKKAAVKKAVKKKEAVKESAKNVKK